MDMFRREIPYNPEGALSMAKNIYATNPNINVH